MAIYSTLTPVTQELHGIFESSRLHCSENGPIYDLLAVEVTGEGETQKVTPIDVDNGTPLCVGEYTHEDDGLQVRYATIAGIKDQVAIAGTPALIKVAFTKAQAAITNFYNVAGKPLKGYSVDDKFGLTEVFAVGMQNFTEASQAAVKVDAYVVTDGAGKWVAQAAKPDASAYGFIGKIHSIAPDMLENTTALLSRLFATATQKTKVPKIAELMSADAEDNETKQ